MPSQKNDKNYQTRLELGFIISLLIVILLFVLSKRYNVSYESMGLPKIAFDFLVENVPETRQGIPRKRPKRPDVIIPVEDEVVPEDETIEDFEFSLFDGPEGPPQYPEGEGFSAEILPRPIAEVIPEFPKEDLKNKVEGVVSLHIYVNSKGKVEKVIILENTTGSTRCADAAKKAAFKNRFIPAKMKQKSIGMWIIKKYTFSVPK